MGEMGMGHGIENSKMMKSLPALLRKKQLQMFLSHNSERVAEIHRLHLLQIQHKQHSPIFG